MTNNLRKIRRSKDLSQEEVAQMVGMSRTYLSDIENDKRTPSVKTSLKLADALKTSVEEIFLQKT